MAIDIQGLNDALLKTSKNYDEAVRKWVDLALAPAKDVPIEYYDPNGNLVQTTVPNRAKLFNDLLGNVNSAMNRTYYVDAINGNDLNDGSQIAPFKTLTKAIESVPVGGLGNVVLLSNIELANEPSAIAFQNKSIRLALNGFTLSKTNTTNRFYCGLGFGFLSIKGNGNIILDNSLTATNTNYLKSLIHIDANAFAVTSLNWDSVSRINISMDSHLIMVTRGIGRVDVIGCDFTPINGASGINVSSVVDGGDIQAYGTGNTGIDGINIVALSGRITAY